MFSSFLFLLLSLLMHDTSTRSSVLNLVPSKITSMCGNAVRCFMCELSFQVKGHGVGRSIQKRREQGDGALSDCPRFHLALA
jgi:hypothetical protein